MLGRVALVTLVLVVLALAERSVRFFQAGQIPSGEAEWIWVPDVAEGGQPIAFYAVRDFELEEVPSAARVMIAVDEEYQLFVNGRRVGSGCYASDPDLDVYDLSGDLRVGANRLVVEARSRFGAGGLLAALFTGSSAEELSRPILVSDSSWLVSRRHVPGLLEGYVSLSEDAERAMSWGHPSIGRWGVPHLGDELHQSVTPGVQASMADPPDGVMAEPVHFGELEPVWARELSSIQLIVGSGDNEVAKRATLIDFGEPVTGYLELWLRVDPTRAYRLLFSSEKPMGRLETLSPLATEHVVLAMPEREFWRDSMPRRFRYALLPGAAVVAARLTPVNGASAHMVQEGVHDTPGLLGLHPGPPGLGITR